MAFYKLPTFLAPVNPYSNFLGYVDSVNTQQKLLKNLSV
jgi:hypothetical protein